MISRFGILLLESELAINFATGYPATYAHKRSAARAMLRSLPTWLASDARVVRVDVDTLTRTFVVHS